MLLDLCASRGVGIRDIQSDNRSAHIIAVRREFCILAKQQNIGCVLIGKLIHRGHATVLYNQSSEYRDRKNQRRVKGMPRPDGYRRDGIGRFIGGRI